jgi:hypothetical protein
MEKPVRVGLMSFTPLIMHADKLLAVMNIGINNADCYTGIKAMRINVK